MKNKKHVLCFYQVYENDALKNYLEHMAQKGWKLTGFDNFFLHFQACVPHPIRYCVEVMENASPLRLQSVPLLNPIPGVLPGCRLGLQRHQRISPRILHRRHGGHPCGD